MFNDEMMCLEIEHEIAEMVNTAKTLPYISTYNPRNIDAFNTMTENLPLLHKENEYNYKQH